VQQWVGQVELLASAVQVDGVQHMKALEQGQVIGSHCEGTRYDASGLRLKMSQRHDSVSASL